MYDKCDIGTYFDSIINTAINKTYNHYNENIIQPAERYHRKHIRKKIKANSHSGNKYR